MSKVWCDKMHLTGNVNAVEIELSSSCEV